MAQQATQKSRLQSWSIKPEPDADEASGKELRLALSLVDRNLRELMAPAIYKTVQITTCDAASALRACIDSDSKSVTTWLEVYTRSVVVSGIDFDAHAYPDEFGQDLDENLDEDLDDLPPNPSLSSDICRFLDDVLQILGHCKNLQHQTLDFSDIAYTWREVYITFTDDPLESTTIPYDEDPADAAAEGFKLLPSPQHLKSLSCRFWSAQSPDLPSLQTLHTHPVQLAISFKDTPLPALRNLILEDDDEGIYNEALGDFLEAHGNALHSLVLESFDHSHVWGYCHNLEEVTFPIRDITRPNSAEAPAINASRINLILPSDMRTNLINQQWFVPLEDQEWLMAMTYLVRCASNQGSKLKVVQISSKDLWEIMMEHPTNPISAWAQELSRFQVQLLSYIGEVV